MSKFDMYPDRFELLEQAENWSRYRDNATGQELFFPANTSSVAPKQANIEKTDAGSAGVLQGDGNTETVSVGDGVESFANQLNELAEILSEFASNAEKKYSDSDVVLYYEGSKALYRAADRIRRAVDVYG